MQKIVTTKIRSWILWATIMPFYLQLGCGAPMNSSKQGLNYEGSAGLEPKHISSALPIMGDESLKIESKDISQEMTNEIRKQILDRFDHRYSISINIWTRSDIGLRYYVYWTVRSGDITSKQQKLSLVAPNPNIVFGSRRDEMYRKQRKKIAQKVTDSIGEMKLTRFTPSTKGLSAILNIKVMGPSQEYRKKWFAINNKLTEDIANLKKQRGEFETSEEYRARMDNFARDKAKLEEAAASDKALAVAELHEKMCLVADSLSTAFTCGVTRIGRYDIDGECFDVFLGKDSEHVHVPKAEAETFKQNTSRLTATGEITYTPPKYIDDDTQYTPLTFHFVNAIVTDPQTGRDYRWGEDGTVAARSTEGLLPPKLTASAHFREDSSDGVLNAGESGTLVLKMTNHGEGPATNVIAELDATEPAAGLEYDRSALFGVIQSGESKSHEFSLHGNLDIVSAVRRFKLSFREGNGFEPDPVIISITTQALVPPDLQLVDFGVADGSGDSRIDAGELLEITARIQNRGAGEAKIVKAGVRLSENLFFAEGTDRSFELGNISVGAYKDIVFSVVTNRRARGEIPVYIDLKENTGRFSKQEKLILAVDTGVKKPAEIVFEPKAGTSPAAIADVATLSVDIEQDIPATSQRRPDAFAVVIGNRNYLRVKNVEFAMRDAALVREYLVGAFGFKPGNIFLIEDATKADFELYFGSESNHKGKLYNAVKPGKSEVFIFYSGHGAPGLKDKQGYFVPVNVDLNYLETMGYPLSVFYHNLARIPASSYTVVLDACFSGAGLYENISPVGITIGKPDYLLENGVVFSSSTGDQVSCWYNEKKHGMFTYFFLKAIHDRSADTNSDGRLTVREAFSYISDSTEGVPYYARMIHGIEQNPQVEGIDMDRVLVVYE